MRHTFFFWFYLLISFVTPIPLFSETEFDPSDTLNPITAYRLPISTVPFLSSRPVIDGQLEQKEWMQAALFSGLHTQAGYLGGSGLMHEDFAQMFIGYDDRALYVAFTTERPANARKPKAEYVAAEDLSNERNLWKDDRVEILIQPKSGKTYHFAVNAQGQQADGILLASTDRSWHGQWESKAIITDNGWQCEVRIPFENFQKGFPDPGQMWRFLIMRGRRTPEKNLSTLSYLTTWAKPEEYARIIFNSPQTPTIQVPKLGPMGLNEVGLKIHIQNSEKPTDVLVEAALYKKRDDVVTFMGENKLDKEEEILIPITMEWAFYQEFLPNGWQAALDTTQQLQGWQETVTLKPNESWMVQWSIPSDEGQYLCTYTVKDAVTGQILAARAMPFEKRNPLQMKIEPWILMNDQIRVTVTCDPTLMNSLQTKIDLALKDLKGALLFSKNITIDQNSNSCLFILSAEKYLGKTLEFQAKLLDSKVQIPVITKQVFDIPDKPQWLGNSYGITNEVPKPWKPITVKDNQANVFLRSYTMGSNGLPQQIISLNKTLLSGPIRLHVDNQQLQWKTKLIRQEASHVIWESTSKTSQWNLKLISTLEFDGMIRCDLTFIPIKNKTRLRNIELEIPYCKDRNIEKLPIVKSDFEPLVQLGDFETGLCWAAEWSKGWQIGKKPVIEIQESNDCIDWRIRFIGQEGVELMKPLTLTWILEALPVKQWNTEYRDLRVIKYPGSEEDFMSPGLIPDSMTENSLRYPLAGNVLPNSGSICFNFIPGDTLNVPKIRVLQIPSSGQDLTLYYERQKRKGDSWPYKQSLALYHGKNEVVRLFPIMRQLKTPWLTAGLSWEKHDDEMKIMLSAIGSKGSPIMGQGSVSWEQWQNIFHSRQLIFGGEKSIALDEICIQNAPLSTKSIEYFSQQKMKSNPSVLLLDHLDHLVFEKGKYRTCPDKIITGKGGIAGAKYTSTFIEMIEGCFGKGVLLPAGIRRNTYDYAKSLGSEIFFPNQGQWQAMCGYYSPTFVPDPILKKRWHYLRNQGFGIITYTGFAFDPELDPLIGPYMEELSRIPVVKIYTGYVPCRATPAVDYYTWGLKKSIDYYGIQGLHLDASWDCKNECKGTACGCGWEDKNGNLHGRHTIFANREFAKRFYHLMKSYRKESYGKVGYLGLHSGASEFPMVSAFADVCKHGEGGKFTSSDFALNPVLPEDFDLLVTARRSGIPMEILTKDSNMPYGPNYLYLYTLLFEMGLRNKDFHLFPEYWHMDLENPEEKPAKRDFERKNLPDFNPYGAQVGISGYPLPTTLLWMLMDDFGCKEATFIPFWKINPLLKTDQKRIRFAAWVHPQSRVLAIVSNFTGKPVELFVNTNWDKLGLDPANIEIFDGITGENIDFSDDGFQVFVDNGPYRLIRME